MTMTSNRALKSLLTVATALTLSVAGAGCGAPDPSAEDTSTENEALTANEHAAFEFFVGKGLKHFQAAAIVGNLIQESGVSPTIKQFGGGPGRGIAQWSAGGRWDHDAGDNVAWYAARHGQSEWALNTQLEFIWYELETFSGYGLSALKSSTTIGHATVVFQDRFEGCGACDESNRIKYAEQVLAAYH
jgi:hypothetical protein